VVTALRGAALHAGSPAGRSFGSTVGRELSGAHAAALKQCVGERREAEGGNFSLLVRIAGDGSVEEVLALPETRIAECLRNAVRQSHFSRPPEPSYWVRVDLGVAD
jgi:hypothetical protein